MQSTVITFVLYFIVIILIGFAGYFATKDKRDYLLGGRSFGPVITAMGVGASDMGGWLMMALPGGVYASGLVELWMVIGILIGAWVNWYLVAPRLRAYSEQANDSLTIPSFLSNRFNDNSGVLRGITGVVCLVFFTFYSAAGFVSAGTLFSSIFDMSYLNGMILSAVLIVFYTTIGGFLAVNWVDLWQGLLMLFALLFLPLVAFSVVSQETVPALIENTHPPLLETLFSANKIAMISMLAWGLGYFGQPHILVRFMAAKTVAELSTARRVCMTWMFLSLMGAVLTGYFGYLYFIDNPLDNPETVFLKLAVALMNPWVTGLMLAAVLSAIMSTLSAQLLVSASAFAEDFYAAHFRKTATKKELLWVSRLAVLSVAAIAFMIALTPKTSILDLVGYAWAGLGASFGPVILLSLIWPRMTKNGALLGLFCGGVVVILFDQLDQWYGGWFAIYEIIPAFAAGLLGCVLGSLCGAKPGLKQQEEYQEAIKKSQAKSE